MALVFPISASVGQTYQSGSSNTYEWTGDYWKIKNVINFNQFSASIDNRINAATNEGQFATTGSNTFVGGQIAPSFTSDQITANDRAYLRTIDGISNTPIDVVAPISLSGSLNISGSIIPATGNGTFTSSFSLGSPTNAWKDLYLSHGSIIFVDAITQATSSFSIENNAGGVDTVKYTAAITASRYLGDGSRLTNLPSTTNWNKDKEYVLRNTEQLTFSGDYILEDSALYIDGGDEEVEYSADKSFKKEGKIFIGGNLLVKDSYIENNGLISVGGEVILIGDSRIEGTGTII